MMSRLVATWLGSLSVPVAAAASSGQAHSRIADLVRQIVGAFGGYIGVVLICLAAAGVLFLFDWLSSGKEGEERDPH